MAHDHSHPAVPPGQDALHPHGSHAHASHHGHGHGHHHGHHHPQPEAGSRAFALAVTLNLGFVLVEFLFGLRAHSTALVADAGHNLSDVLGLLLAWGAAVLARRPPAGRYTYGLRSSSILAALANAAFLLVACGAIAWEAVLRFATPHAVAGFTVTVVAAAGVAINGLSAWLFVRHSKGDLNVRAAYWHLMADAAVSLAVVLAGVVILRTGWDWLDPALSLVIVAVIVVGTWGLLRESLELALNAVPAHVDMQAVETYLRQCPGVSEVHDLHIWGMRTPESALTAHLVMPQGYPGAQAMDAIMLALKERFHVQHSTLQIEQGTTHHACALLHSSPAALQPHA
jgi:cobalt-zinc-cadmium efflux system protein